MREIKFRAWNVEDNRMESVSEIRFYSGSTVCSTVHEETDDDSEWVVEIPIMQYTGLKDCNGVEIYEGDICKLLFHADRSFESIAEVRYRKYQFEFWNDNEFKQAYNPKGGFWSKSAQALSWYSCPFHVIDIQVIGNIYENPELLENDK